MRGKSEAPIGMDTGTVFQRYFRARWQNWQNIVSRATFYTQMPTEWVTYQNNFVKQWEQWASGFVLTLHRGDFFSTGMGKTVCDILVRECMRGNYRFDSADADASKRLSNWAADNHMDEVIMNGFAFANRLGNAILRLNINAQKAAIYPTVHPVNSTYFQVNRAGKIVKARFFDMLDDGTTENEKYIVVEDRIMLDDKPYYRVCLKKFNSVATNPQMTNGANVNSFDTLDDGAKSTFKALYGNIKLGVWYGLPFKTLGCYNWKNTSTSSAVTEMHGYSDSSLHTALDILYAIDYNYSMGQLDQYFGRTMVLIPPEMQRKTGEHVIFQGKDYDEAVLSVQEAPLSGTVFVQTPSGNNGILDGKPTAPIFIQSNLRGAERKQLHDFYLEMLAAKVGLSSSTLANHLTYNAAKTATEIDKESDTTDVTVANKRDLANIAINDMLKEVCNYIGINAEVDITWNRTGTGNKDAIMEEYRAGIMPLKECIARLHPELSKAEVEQWVNELAEQQQQQAATSNGDLDKIFGLGDEH